MLRFVEFESQSRVGAIYGRVSVLDTENEIEHGSLEQQQHMGFEQAKYLSKNTGVEHTIKHVLIEDKGISGGTSYRPKYQELLKLISERKIDFVVAKEISRISRSTSDFCQFMTLCKQNNVSVHIRGLDVDFSTPYGSAIHLLRQRHLWKPH